MSDYTLDLERETLLLLTEQFYEVEHFETLREALGRGLDDEKTFTDLLEWEEKKAA